MEWSFVARSITLIWRIFLFAWKIFWMFIHWTLNNYAWRHLYSEKIYELLYLNVSDFKLLYSLSGCFGASSKFPRLFCATPKKLMDRTEQDLCNCLSLELTSQIPRKPGIRDLRGKPHFNKWQKSNKYNLGLLYRSKPSNVVPLPYIFDLAWLTK